MSLRAIDDQRLLGCGGLASVRDLSFLGGGDPPWVERPGASSFVLAFQALPLVASGAAEAFGFGDREIALACASHSGSVPAPLPPARTTA